MASSAADLTARLLRHERAIIACMIVLLTALSWAFLLRDAQMTMMEPPLTAIIIAMWWLMMLAMMLPSATPAILLYARVRQTRAGDASIAQTWVFLVGYLAVWLLFSIVAASVQSLVTDSSMALRSRAAQGAVLVAVGLYQLSPLKTACVSQCRSPGQFISRHWRPGWEGAFRLGVIHGAYCVGCCWMLMGLLFVGGVMNLLWVVGLTILVAAEKLLPGGSLLAKVSGVAFILWGFARVLA
jgi:predicted metal-binding membrane protein